MKYSLVYGRFWHLDLRTFWSPAFPTREVKIAGRYVLAVFPLVSPLLFLGLIAKNNTLKLLSGFPPLAFYSLSSSENDCPLGLNCYKDFEQGLAAAFQQKNPFYSILRVGLVLTVEKWKKIYGHALRCFVF